jgi:HAD superfamily phosphoserine phosphatase-like hydrolase
VIVFDVDGTILPGTSCERLFVRHLISRGLLGPRSLINFIARAIALAPKGRYFTIKANKGYLRGFSADYMAQIGREFFESVAAPRIAKAAVARVEQHRVAGERVILFSGMPDFLLANFAGHLGAKEFYGSAMETCDGRFTGRTLGPFPLARGKVQALELILHGGIIKKTGMACHAPTEGRHALHDDNRGEHVNDPPLDWTAITFYADHWTDRYLLSRVGHPVVVNGREKLLALAQKNGWPTEEWK